MRNAGWLDVRSLQQAGRAGGKRQLVPAPQRGTLHASPGASPSRRGTPLKGSCRIHSGMADPSRRLQLPHTKSGRPKPDSLTHSPLPLPSCRLRVFAASREPLPSPLFPRPSPLTPRPSPLFPAGSFVFSHAKARRFSGQAIVRCKAYFTNTTIICKVRLHD
jgi:hypothetical protein